MNYTILKYSLLSLVLGISIYSTNVKTQSLYGGQILKDWYFPNFEDESWLNVQVELLREGPIADTAYLKCGKLGVVAIPHAASTNVSPTGFRLDIYFASLPIIDTGMYVLEYVDSFLVDDFVNIDKSGLQYLTIRDTAAILYDPEAAGYLIANASANFFNTLGYYKVVEDQIQTWITRGQSTPLDNDDEYRPVIVPFPATGTQVYPSDDNHYYLDGDYLIWDSPMEAGLYAVGLKVREFRDMPDFLEEEYGDSLLISTHTIGIPVIITEDMVVGTFDEREVVLLSVFPNPTADNLHIQYGGTSGPLDITIFDIAGRQHYSAQVQVQAQVQTQRVTVQGWSPGVYQVQLQMEDWQETKKVVVH